MAMLQATILSSLFIALAVEIRQYTGSGIDEVRKSNSNEDDSNLPCVDGLCICFGNEVSCIPKGKRLQYIPKMPNVTTTLLLGNFVLPVITAATFKNVSDLHLKFLTLLDNGIYTISRDAFQNFVFLVALRLQEPYLQLDELKSAFSSLSKNTINCISINRMDLSIIDKQLFCHLNDSKLDRIDFVMNKIRKLDFKIFSCLKYISRINLIQNNLIKLKMATLENLKILDVSYNKITTFPNFCNHSGGKSYFPRLKVLDLSSNRITIIFGEDCLQGLKDLRLRNNPIQYIGDSLLPRLQSLVYLDISKITPRLIRKNHRVFNSTSLKGLTIEEVDDSSFLLGSPESTLKYCPNLTNLSLSGTKLSNSITILSLFFSHTPRIQNLDLSFTGLTVLPEVSFSQMTSLKVLNLQGNRIRTWNGTNLFVSSKISSLSLKGNQISALNSTSIPFNMLKYLAKTSLDLSENPYLCTCQTLESINWFRMHADLLKNYPVGYECLSPPEVIGIGLRDYNPSAESCTEKNIPLLVSIPVSIIAVSTISIILLMYKCRWRLRYGIFLFRQSHKKYDRLEESDAFRFAGFVIYSDADRKWVHDELIHRLEDQEGFRLCIRLRDFEVGKVHVDNIVDNMALSEKIIVILSNNFARDEWCDFQLLLAETKLLKQNTDMLVILILEEINSDCLRASLYKLVSERQFSLWSNDKTGKDLFWRQAVSQMKKYTSKNYGTMV